MTCMERQSRHTLRPHHHHQQCAEICNLEEDILGAARLMDRDFQVPELVIDVPLRTADTGTVGGSAHAVPQSSSKTSTFHQVGVAGGGQQGFLSGQLGRRADR